MDFRRDAISNGNLDNLSDADDNIKDYSDKDEEIDKNNECDKEVEPDAKSGKTNLTKLKRIKRNKKSVQFADGVKPGEGTSPSGGEGDMPSPPPPKGIGFREGLGDLRRDKIYSSRKIKKQEKRVRPSKTKKKVKVCDFCLLPSLSSPLSPPHLFPLLPPLSRLERLRFKKCFPIALCKIQFFTFL